MIKKILHIAIISLLLAIGSCHTAWGATTGVNKTVAEINTHLKTNATLGEADKVWNITDNGTITLTKNVDLLGPIAINQGKKVTIKPSGGPRYITYKGDGETDTGGTCSMFRIRTGATLIIQGNNNDERVYLDGGQSWNNMPELNTKISADHLIPKTPDKTLYHGAIYSIGTLTLTLVSIRNVYNSNPSEDYGGAISIANNASSGPTTLSGVQIYRCVARTGAAIYMHGSDVVVDADATKVSLLKKNTTGTVDEVPNTPVVKETLIYNCKTTAATGMIRTRGHADAKLYMDGAIIRYCYSASNGGAIHWNAAGTANTICQMRGCHFHNNVANGSGGALFMESNFEFVTDTDTGNKTRIQYNRSTSYGGGICVNAYNGGAHERTDYVYDFGDNVMFNGNEGKYGGGLAFAFDAASIASGSTVSINIKGAQITNNIASKYGGGIYMQKDDDATQYTMSTRLNSGTLTSNTSEDVGGGVYINNIDVTSDNSANVFTIDNNTSSNQAGGMYVINADITFNNIKITNNTSTNEFAGGLYARNSKVVINDATVTGNIAAKTGGGMRINNGNSEDEAKGVVGKTVSIAKGTFSNNKAGTYGGAIYIDGGTVSITSGTFANNTATNNGGALYASTSAINAGIVNIGTATFSGNTAANGGGVYANQSTMNITSTAKFQNNKATTTATIADGTGGGGGVFIFKGNLNMSGAATFTGNSSTKRGGGLYVDNGNLNITSATAANISSNTSSLGGAGFFVRHGNVDIKKATISSNTSSTHGGGFYVMGNDEGTKGFVTLGTVTLEGNKANYVSNTGNGGAICLDKGGLTITESATINTNTATGYGGGIYASNGDVSIANATLTSNSANAGGGIYTSGNGTLGDITITNATFDQNKALSGNGGGIYLTSGDLNITKKATFTSNSATNVGGGMYATGGEVIIADAELTSNTAKNGGGIYASMGSVTITNATFDQNKATAGGGGGLYVNQSNINIKTDATFTSNTATASGGAVYATAGAVTIKNADIESNTATTSGGGIYATGGDVTITTATLSSNQAADGGGMYVNNGNINITSKATITSNTATTAAGGGIYAASGGITIADADISGNNATTKGGGICLNGGTLTITKGDIKNNTAGTFGGGLHAESASAKTITLAGDGVFSSNTATTCGGGISVSGPITFNTSGTIESNSAKNGGGIYLTGGATMNFNEGMIRYNRATGTTGSAFTTAYQKTASQVYGVGGGVFVEESSKLLFNIGSTSFGLYGNSAEIAADDIFANGNNTTVQIPQVDAMVLNDFNVTTSRLLWAEDYVTGDTGYANGTKIINNWDALDDKFAHVIRYKAAQSILALRELVFTGSSLTLPRAIDAAYPPGPANYVCLTLGFNNMSVKITRTGLKMGESAIYTYTRSGDSEPMGRVVLTGMGESVPVSKLVVLSEGTWIIAENSWTYSYNVTAPSITRTISAASTDQERTFTFASAKESVPPHDEGNTVNSLK